MWTPRPNDVKVSFSDAQSLTPIAGTPCVVGERNHDDFRIALENDNGVREASEDQSLDSALSGDAGHGYQRDDFFFEQIEGSFVRRRFVDAQSAH